MSSRVPLGIPEGPGNAPPCLGMLQEMLQEMLLPAQEMLLPAWEMLLPAWEMLSLAFTEKVFKRSLLMASKPKMHPEEL